MRKNFYNRDDERNSIDEILKLSHEYDISTIWIEGKSGVGKTAIFNYAKEYTNINKFIFADGLDYHKCHKKQEDLKFNLISSVLVSIEEQYSDLFSHYIYDYFNNFSNPSLIEGIQRIIPSIDKFKWVKDIFKNNLHREEIAQTKITEHLLNKHLTKCFANVIYNILSDQRNNILFAIDDICWIDDESFETFIMLINLVKSNKKTFSLLFIFTSRDKLSMDTPEKYLYIERFFKENSSLYELLVISNFTKRVTKEFIETESSNKFLLNENIDTLYEITRGNPQELVQTIKFTEDELNAKINEYKSNHYFVNDDRFFSEQLIKKYLLEDVITEKILILLSLLDNKIELTQLTLFVLKFIQMDKQHSIVISDIENAINKLVTDEICLLHNNTTKISHDSIGEIVKNYLIETGDYKYIVKLISSLIIDNNIINKVFKFPDNFILATDILKTSNPIDCFDIYINHQLKFNETFPKRFIENIAYALMSEISLLSDCEILNTYSLKLLKLLFSFSSFTIAEQLAYHLYKIENKLNNQNRYDLYIIYTKILIEKDILDNRTPSALMIINKIIENSSVPENILIESILLKTSVLEHLMKYDEIKNLYSEVYSKLSGMIKNKNFKLITIYYRNMGLIKSHGEALQDYLKSLYYSNKILYTLNEEKNLIQGTCYNNIGLGFMFNGDIESAIKSFNKSYLLLERAQYDFHRPMNNLAMCFILLKDFLKAYDYLLLAKSTSFIGSFELSAITINMSLVLWELGNKNEALELINNVLQTYDTEDRTSDEVIYARAKMIKAYFFFKEEQYIDASKLYKDSMNHCFRYLHEEEQKRRKFMVHYCLFKEDLLPENENSMKIDIESKNKTFIKQIFDMQPLAFYIV